MSENANHLHDDPPRHSHFHHFSDLKPEYSLPWWLPWALVLLALSIAFLSFTLTPQQQPKKTKALTTHAVDIYPAHS